MAYPASVAVIITEGTLFGEKVVNRLVYAHDDFQSNASSGAMADEFYSDVWSVWKPLVHASFTLNTIEATIYQTPSSGNKPSYKKFVNEQGTITATDALPSYVTLGLTKMPDNTTKEPSSTDDFRRGYWRISGLAEGQVAFGLVTSAAMTAFNALAEAVEELVVDFGSGDRTYRLMIDRFQVGGNNPMVQVAEVLVPYKVGSQNTRKF